MMSSWEWSEEKHSEEVEEINQYGKLEKKIITYTVYTHDHGNGVQSTVFEEEEGWVFRHEFDADTGKVSSDWEFHEDPKSAMKEAEDFWHKNI